MIDKGAELPSSNIERSEKNEEEQKGEDLTAEGLRPSLDKEPPTPTGENPKAPQGLTPHI